MINLNIPFTLYNQKGIIDVQYGKNKSVSESGFDLLKHLKFDLNMCIGYPTIHIKINEFEATGYKRMCGWIQILELDYFNSKDSINYDTRRYVIDSSSSMNSPFFCQGYPAELYDAPCNNLGSCFKLSWKARTYLVTCPESFNNNTISFIAGVKWGYDEQRTKDNELKVEIHDISQTDYNNWKKDIDILKSEFPSYSYL